jgi:hypothetical protein
VLDEYHSALFYNQDVAASRFLDLHCSREARLL